MTHRAPSSPRRRAPGLATGPARHRGERRPPRVGRWVLSGVAALAITGGSVTAGVVALGDPSGASTTYLAAALVGTTETPAQSPQLPTIVRDRAQQLSRSSERREVAPAKKALLSQASGGQLTKVADLRSGDPKGIAKALLLEYGFATSTFSCLDQLWTEESHWRVNAQNRNSGAYGIPQALPGSKMASVADDWRTNPETQIRWGLGYIKQRYGDPCNALAHKHSRGWY